MNAVKIQIYCAITAYCRIAIICNKLKADRSIYKILQILSMTLLEQTPVREMLTDYGYKDVKEQIIEQLRISGFLMPISVIFNPIIFN